MNPIVRHSRRCVRLLKRFAYFLLPPAFYSPLKEFLPRLIQKKTRQQLSRAIRRRFSSFNELDCEARQTFLNADTTYAERTEAFQHYEETLELVRKKANCHRGLLGHRLDRVRLYREIARLERTNGNDLTAAVYAIRSMRLLGQDRFGDLFWSLAVLNQHGYRPEAQVADAMFGTFADRRDRCRQLLHAAYQRCQSLPPPCEFTVHDDQRGNCQPRVSVIVSLYNAADKVPVFVDLLRRQSLLRAGQLEIIFVDSASPADEHGAIRSSCSVDDVPYLFVRTSERESIQTAWNRGISLAQAPYLAFLGVDETVLPTAYEELASELDTHAEIDWVVGDGLVTEVDARGNPVRDVMFYDREGFTQDLTYLDTCYLTFVGGLYRRSIHDRFGYYDGSFRAAGDTEFKGRVLPHIRAKRLPRTFGLFLNYPEARTTESPRAELEDLRAWYLHRSAAGVDYAFGKRSSAELEAMVLRSIGYRKTYCQHWSSDVEYASAAIEVLRKLAPASPVLALESNVTRLLDAYRTLDYLPNVTAADIENAIGAVHRATAELMSKLSRFVDNALEKPSIFQDNRFEQHIQAW